jgi:hypothetical protein
MAPSTKADQGQSLGVVRVSLDYRSSHRQDRWGNEFRYSAPVDFSSGVGNRESVDVYLKVLWSCVGR